MKILDRYIGAGLLLKALSGVVILCLVLVVGNVTKELLSLMISRNLPLLDVLWFMVLVIPFSLPYTIPWAYLTAILLTFGRLSADNELLAFQSSGTSLFRLAAPALAVAILLSLFCLALNVQIAPAASQKMFSSIADMAANDPMTMFPEEDVITDLADRRIYVGNKEANTLHNLIIFEINPEGSPLRLVTAKTGTLTPGTEKGRLTIKLTQARIEERDAKEPDNLRKVRNGILLGEGTYSINLDFVLRSLNRLRTTPVMTLAQLKEYIDAGGGGEMLKARIEYQKRFSLSMACIAFTCIGIPLGIAAHRRETSAGFAISLIVAFSYFFFIVLAHAFYETPEAHPTLLIWLPNLLCMALGGVLFYRLKLR